MTTATKHLWILGFLLLGSGRGLVAQTIKLLPDAAVDRGTVTLGQLATITDATPADAELLAQTVLVKKTTGPTKVSGEDILFAIISQDGASYASTLRLVGSANCAVSIREPVAATVAVTSIPAPALVDVKPIAAPAQTTTAAPLSKLLAAELVTRNGVDAQDLHVSFETATALLESPAPTDGHWMIKPITHENIGTQQWDCQLVIGGKVAQQIRIQASVQKRTRILVASHDIPRTTILSETDFKAEDRWMDRPMPTVLMDPKQAIGMEAFARNLPSGEMLDERDVRNVDVVKRGDVVTLYCVAKGLTLKSQVKALEPGKLHDLVWMSTDVSTPNDSTGGERFQVRMIGRGVAVLGDALTADEETKLKEMQ